MSSDTMPCLQFHSRQVQVRQQLQWCPQDLTQHGHGQGMHIHLQGTQVGQLQHEPGLRAPGGVVAAAAAGRPGWRSERAAGAEAAAEPADARLLQSAASKPFWCLTRSARSGPVVTPMITSCQQTSGRSVGHVLHLEHCCHVSRSTAAVRPRVSLMSLWVLST
jgi:hypothetical protein